MARLLYSVQDPEGRTLTTTTPDYCVHHVAVIGYMRLRKALPKLLPDDPKEETRYTHFKAWVLIGTAETQAKAERLAVCQGYRGVTEEVRYMPVEGVPIVAAASVHVEDTSSALPQPVQKDALDA